MKTNHKRSDFSITMEVLYELGKLLYFFAMCVAVLFIAGYALFSVCSAIGDALKQTLFQLLR